MHFLSQSTQNLHANGELWRGVTSLREATRIWVSKKSHCLSSLSAAVKNTVTKGNLGREGFI